MSFLVSPAVEVNEIDLTNVIPALATSVAGFAGFFNWGPVLQPTVVGSEKDLGKIFGTPTDNADVGRSFLTAASFLKYGNNLKVVRALPTGALNAGVDLTGYADPQLVTTPEEFETAALSGVYGKFPGALGDGVGVVVLDAVSWLDVTANPYKGNFDYEPNTSEWAAALTGSTNVKDEVHVLVIDTTGTFSGRVGAILEKYQGLSIAVNAKTSAGGGNYYADVLNRRSEYVYVAGLEELMVEEAGPITLTANSANLTGIVDHDVVNLVTDGGDDGSYASSESIVDALDIFDDVETVDLNLLFAHNFIEDVTYTFTTEQGKIDAKLDEIASQRKDIVAFVSAPVSITSLSESQKLAAILDKFNLFNTNSYVVFDSTPVQTYNKFTDSFVWIPASGHMAGLCAYTDQVAEPWFSPGGLNRGIMRGISKIAFNPKLAQRDELYKSRVNPVVSISGTGTAVLFGDKTAQTKPSAFDRINVRRLFITLEKAIATFAKFQLFEFNDEFTRSAFKNTVEPYLRDVRGRRGLIDFRVVCDETNNTAEVIDNNGFVGDIYLKPARSINWIRLNFIATRTGVEFKELVGE